MKAIVMSHSRSGFRAPCGLVLLCAMQLMLACAPTARVTRVDEAAVTDVSGRWNDTDSRLVAEQMIAECLASPWIDKATATLGRSPVVIVQKVRNQSMEHIQTAPFVEELQRALINSGVIEFVADSRERQSLREERMDQDRNASDETRQEMGAETGADYSLKGEINATLDRSGGTGVMAYQVNLKLIHIKTNKIVWNGQKKVKKVIQRDAWRM